MKIGVAHKKKSNCMIEAYIFNLNNLFWTHKIAILSGLEELRKRRDISFAFGSLLNEMGPIMSSSDSLVG